MDPKEKRPGFNWEDLAKALAEGKFKIPPMGHFREEMMKGYEAGRETRHWIPSKDTGQLRPFYTRTNDDIADEIPQSFTMPAYTMTKRIIPDYEAQCRNILKDDFERLTANPVILDDVCMVLIGDWIEIEEMQQGMPTLENPYTPDHPLQLRRDQIADELTLMSALLLRYPEIERGREARAHVRLNWQLLAYLACMPLNNTPHRTMIVRLYTTTLIRGLSSLLVQS